jgi:hypothetical protein
MRRWLGVAFLAVQVAWILIVHASGMSARYFCWAPNDSMVTYQIRVVEHGQILSSSQIASRYGFAAQGLYEYPVAHLEDAIRQYEQTYGRGDGAEVSMTYTINGGTQDVWTWS